MSDKLKLPTVMQERAEMQAAIAELRLALEKVKGECFEDSEFGTLIEQTLNNTKKWSD